MTHHTDAERAQFEAWARGYGTWEVKRDDDVALGTTGYTDITLTVAWHAVQAARRAPAAPVPQGWRYVPEVLTPEMKREFMDMLMDGIDIYMNSNDQIEIQTDAPRRIWKSILAAAPQPPDAAPVQLPEPRWHSPSPCDAAHFPYYTPEDVRQLLAQHGIK